nr:Crp/Fnr family transcriptional regulator [Altererythrobacter sp. KTW20L]
MDMAREGEEPQALRVMLSGWAMRYTQLPDGRRQIVGLCLPGDLCDLDLFTVMRSDHSLATVRRSTIAELGLGELREVMAACPGLSQALCRSEIVSSAIQREWLTSLGQRSAIERVAHLFCELFVRQRGHWPIEAGRSRSCDFFLTQSQIAEVTGLTQVHVNRTVQQLRQSHGVELRQLRLDIPDFAALARRAAFSPQYLHLAEAGPMTAMAEVLFRSAHPPFREAWLSAMFEGRQPSPAT